MKRRTVALERESSVAVEGQERVVVNAEEGVAGRGSQTEDSEVYLVAVVRPPEELLEP